MTHVLAWIPGGAFLAAPLLLLLLLLVPPVAMIAVLVAALAAVVGLVALAGAMLAMPYLLGRALLRHRRAQRQSAEDKAPIASVTASTQRATPKHSGVAAYAGSTTSRRSP
jgi:hypothetical protein